MTEVQKRNQENKEVKKGLLKFVIIVVIVTTALCLMFL
jgi:flagellar basal body-associated protein FliL